VHGRPPDSPVPSACGGPKLLAQQQPVVLTNPFQHGKNLTQASPSTDGGSQGPPPSSSNPSSANVYMMKGDAYISTRAHDYRMPNTSEKSKEAKNPPLPLQIEKTLGETMTHIPKGAFKKDSHNPNARAAQNYSVVEDLSQTPCVMSALEVLQSCPSQRKALLATLGSVETCNLGTIMLDTTDLKPRLPYHMAFQIVVAYTTKNFTQNIFRTVVDEGASTCVMSLACWKAIGQPFLSPSPTLLTTFDGHSFRPHGIIPSFPMQLGGKTMCIEVEVVDASLDYNLLLGRSWTYAMQAVVATVFWVLLFPHEGHIMTIDQLSFSHPDPSFRTTYFNDPWTLPSPSTMMEGTGHHGMAMPLSISEVAYSIVQQASADPDLTPAQELDPILEPTWAQGSLANTDSLDLVLPSDEAIIEAMTSLDRPWDDLHHRSYFLPELRRIEAGEFTLTMTGDRSCPINPLAMHTCLCQG
jgi:hypothetical protein